MRWLEQVQHDMDLLIIDEADAVQQVLDDRFVQEENLVSGEDGWTHRMVDDTNKAMARMRIAQASDPQVQQWYELLLIHEQAVFALYRLALSEGGEALRDLLGVPLPRGPAFSRTTCSVMSPVKSIREGSAGSGCGIRW